MSGMTRSGIGFDSHIFSTGGTLMLGGVAFPNEPALEGHSDGDALLHAIIDAMLGACALGDIGGLFPDTAPEFKGIPSLKMLAGALSKIQNAGFEVHNVDAVVVADKPKLSTARDEIRATIAKGLGIKPNSVSLKGKTQEGLSWFGKGGGIAVWATVTVKAVGA